MEWLCISLHISEMTGNIFKNEKYSLYVLQHPCIICVTFFSWKYYISILFLQWLYFESSIIIWQGPCNHKSNESKYRQRAIVLHKRDRPPAKSPLMQKNTSLLCTTWILKKEKDFCIDYNLLLLKHVPPNLKHIYMLTQIQQPTF